MSRTYSKRTCFICRPRRDITAAGAAWVSHGRSHVRRQEAIEYKERDGSIKFAGVGIGMEVYLRKNPAAGTAKIVKVIGQNGEVELDRILDGFRYWNVLDFRRAPAPRT